MLAVCLADIARNYFKSTVNGIEDVLCNHNFSTHDFRAYLQTLVEYQNVKSAIVHECTGSNELVERHNISAPLVRYALWALRML